MTTSRRLTAALAAAVVASLPALSFTSTLHQYVEDFSTTQYRDGELTTAWWDTVAGELKLFPVSITLQGVYDSPGSAYDVAVADSLAFLADDAAGLHVISINDPTSLQWLATCDIPGSARGVVVAGGYAYVAAGGSGLQVVDVHDPHDPQIVGAFDTPGFAHDVAVAGPYAYVAQSGHGLQVIGIGDPTDPVPVGSTGTSDWAQAVAVVGEVAYVADGLGGMQVVDVSDPATPLVVGSHPPADYAFGIFAAGDTVYLADGAAGLQILAVGDPTAPILRGSGDTPGSARDVHVAGSYAYVADGSAGFTLLDISEPTAVVLSGRLATSGNSLGIAFDGDHVHLAAGSAGLLTISVNPGGFDIVNNKAQSLVLDQSSDPIVRARLTTVQEDTIRWELSADGGTSWEEIIPGADWHSFSTTGNSLLWRSTHIYLANDINPSCSRLEIAWEKRYSHAVIDSISDVPDDQGLQVRISFTASRFDSVGSTTPITEYAIFRRIDPLGDASAATSFNARGPGVLSPTSYPPGEWDFLLTVPADAEERYVTVVPTLADSTAWGGVHYTTFFVRARTGTPGVFFDSPPDSGYSMNNLLPSVPTGFSVAYNSSDGNLLTWSPSPDEDFASFRVYRGSEPFFVPAPANLVFTTTGTSWLDEGNDPWYVYYLLTAVDTAGNESPATFPLTVTPVIAPDMPSSPALYQNVPNPFNPVTTIAYDVPGGGGPIRLEIFDLRGRLVRVLVDDRPPPGRQQVRWDGTDSHGRNVPAGVYTYRLRAPGFAKSRKMILVQ